MLCPDIMRIEFDKEILARTLIQVLQKPGSTSQYSIQKSDDGNVYVRIENPDRDDVVIPATKDQLERFRTPGEDKRQ